MNSMTAVTVVVIGLITMGAISNYYINKMN